MENKLKYDEAVAQRVVAEALSVAEVNGDAFEVDRLKRVLSNADWTYNFYRQDQEKKRVEWLRKSILEMADHCCSDVEYDALKSYIKHITDIDLLITLEDYYKEWLDEKTADML